MTSTLEARPLEVAALRELFPLLRQQSHGKRLVYLDSASSSQRPRAVLEAMDQYYETTHANVHRGIYAIAEEATRRFEMARRATGEFIKAPRPDTEIIFTKNATEALNLVAHSYGRHVLASGKAVLLTELEHHSNLVPWQMLASERGLELRYIPVGDDYRLDLSDLDRLVDGVGLVGVSCMSNVLGTINDLSEIVKAAHSVGAVVLADGSQLVPHRSVNVRELDVDFLAFTGHKMMGPTGIGVLWGKEELLDEMPPFLGGGEMIRDVRLDGFVPNDLPWKFEAGTPPIAEAVGLHAAIDFLETVGMDRIEAHERSLTTRAIDVLSERHGDDLTIYGPTDGRIPRGGVLSLGLRDIHAHDLAQVLDAEGVCVRAGHHCAKPLMRRLGITATARASFYLYNGEDDIEALSDALDAAKAFFG
ncbi:MAG: SufS family cysteine desulfurase [Acidimicrobiales bacterium]|jgi:cysteine desulfurase/selenocysteine lyase